MAMRNSGFGRGGHPYHGPPYPSPMYRSSSPMPPPPPPHMNEFGPPHMPPPPGPFGSSMGPPPPQGPRMGGRGAGFHSPFNQRFAPYHVPPQKNGIPRPGPPNKNIRKGKPNNRPNSKGPPNKGVQNTNTDTNNSTDPNKVGAAPTEGGNNQIQQDTKDGNGAINNGTTVTELKVPPELMEPLYCKLCDIKLNGTLQASAHYEGKSHAKKARQYLDKLRKEKGITAPLPATNGKSEGKEKKNQPSEMYCKLCDVAFTSDIQAKQHHNGRNHQRRLRGEPPLPKGFYNAATGKWQRQPPAGVAYPSAPQTKKTQEFECTICNSKMTSQAQLDAHLAGAKHRAKVATQSQGTTTIAGSTNNSYYQNTNTLGSSTPATNSMSFVLPGYTASTGTW